MSSAAYKARADPKEKNDEKTYVCGCGCIRAQVSRTAEGTTFGKPLVTAGRARGNAALPPLHRKT